MSWPMPRIVCADISPMRRPFRQTSPSTEKIYFKRQMENWTPVNSNCVGTSLHVAVRDASSTMRTLAGKRCGRVRLGQEGNTWIKHAIVVMASSGYPDVKMILMSGLVIFSNSASALPPISGMMTSVSTRRMGAGPEIRGPHELLLPVICLQNLVAMCFQDRTSQMPYRGSSSTTKNHFRAARQSLGAGGLGRIIDRQIMARKIDIKRRPLGRSRCKR